MRKIMIPLAVVALVALAAMLPAASPFGGGVPTAEASEAQPFELPAEALPEQAGPASYPCPPGFEFVPPGFCVPIPCSPTDPPPNSICYQDPLGEYICFWAWNYYSCSWECSDCWWGDAAARAGEFVPGSVCATKP